MAGMMHRDGNGLYDYIDRFGRVVDQKWYDYGASAVRDRYTYGHDRASNRLYKENVGPSGKDEYYTYDGIYRLTNFDRGDLNANKDAISGTPGREEDFTLDPTGNWTGFVEKTSGTTDLNQSRVQNTVNEITDITETTGTAWITPVQDKAGNMTTVPKPSSLANGLTCKYDAWNRLVEVTDDETIVAKYEYDGQGRRIKKHLDSQSPADPNGIDKYEHFFYTGIQLVETRDTTTENDQPESLQPDYQYVWSDRYIDALILRDQNTDQDSLCDDQRLYYLTDANFNVTILVDISGDALERYLYNPYGRVTIYNADWSSTRNSSSYNNQILYTGRRFDTETGIYYYRARYYSADLGRFVSRDPIGHEDGINLYQYVGNRPFMFADPLGLKACKIHIYVGHTNEVKDALANEISDDVVGIGTVTCGSREINEKLPEDLKIPRILGQVGTCRWENAYDTLKNAFKKAQEHAEDVCKTSDCDSVEIEIECLGRDAPAQIAKDAANSKGKPNLCELDTSRDGRWQTLFLCWGDNWVPPRLLDPPWSPPIYEFELPPIEWPETEIEIQEPDITIPFPPPTVLCP